MVLPKLLRSCHRPSAAFHTQTTTRCPSSLWVRITRPDDRRSSSDDWPSLTAERTRTVGSFHSRSRSGHQRTKRHRAGWWPPSSACWPSTHVFSAVFLDRHLESPVHGQDHRLGVTPAPLFTVTACRETVAPP
jgi:hypothetical protein